MLYIMIKIKFMEIYAHFLFKISNKPNFSFFLASYNQKVLNYRISSFNMKKKPYLEEIYISLSKRILSH